MIKFTAYALVHRGTTEIVTTVSPINGGTIYRIYTSKEEAEGVYGTREHGKYDILPITLDFGSE